MLETVNDILKACVKPEVKLNFNGEQDVSIVLLLNVPSSYQNDKISQDALEDILNRTLLLFIQKFTSLSTELLFQYDSAFENKNIKYDSENYRDFTEDILHTNGNQTTKEVPRREHRR